MCLQLVTQFDAKGCDYSVALKDGNREKNRDVSLIPGEHQHCYPLITPQLPTCVQTSISISFIWMGLQSGSFQGFLLGSFSNPLLSLAYRLWTLGWDDVTWFETMSFCEKALYRNKCINFDLISFYKSLFTYSTYLLLFFNDISLRLK